MIKRIEILTFFVLIALGANLVECGPMGRSLLLAQEAAAPARPVKTNYTSFEGEKVERYVWPGRHIAFQTAHDDLDPATMAALCKTFDAVYEFYHDATQREPVKAKQYHGLVTITEIEKTCGAGCGFLGSTGIELMPDCFDELYRGVVKNKEFDQALPYEFGRNYWFYSPQLDYHDHIDSSSVITGYAVFMRFLALDAAGAKLGPFRDRSGKEFRRQVERMVDLYVADPSLNWANTLKVNRAPENPLGLGSTDLFASFCFRLCRDYGSRDHGGRDYAARLWQAVGKRPAAKTTQEALDNFVVSASIAAHQDLAPLFSKTWRWPVSDAAQLETARLVKPVDEDSGLAALTGKDTPLKANMSIAFFGDSITMQGGYIKSLKEAIDKSPQTKNLKVKLLAHGLNGGRVPTVLEGKSPWGKIDGTMEELLDKEKPDMVVIFLGVNDVWHKEKGTTPDDFQAGLKKMIGLCTVRKAKVVLVTLAVIGEKPDGSNPFDKKLDQYAQLTCDVARENGVSAVELRKEFMDYLKIHNVKDEKGQFKANKVLTYDGVHFQPEGNELAAACIARGIVAAARK